MILSLKIKNIALISDLSLEFTEGLNILSGETGAGKSIIIDSLNFVLGDRADRGLIRHGETCASVTVTFSAQAHLSQILKDNGIDDDEIYVVTRTMQEGGRGECRINGSLINLSLLKKIVTQLVDIHSQHEHQSLLQEANHILILDNYCKEINKRKEVFKNSVFNYKTAINELKSFADADVRARQIDILGYQIAEIEKANLTQGEEEKLTAERHKLLNFQKYSDNLSSALSFMKGDGGLGGLSSLNAAKKDIALAARYDETLNDLNDRLDSVSIELSDIVDTVYSVLKDSKSDSFTLEKTEKRLDEIRKIKKKFGGDIQSAENFLATARAELDRLMQAESRIEELNADIENYAKKVVFEAKTLNKLRFDAAEAFAKAIVKHLIELGMESATFKAEVDFPKTDAEILEKANDQGADTVRFLISPNKGEPLKPLAKIASGGEMSRFMLGLKNITAELENINTLIFDEIDTGISGRIAKVVACKLFNIAKSRQVLAVTHLPQLACMADTHYLISKTELHGKTLTNVTRLNNEQSLNEIMRLAGSATNSAAGLQNAKELKNWANEYKIKLNI
jgi:DNA repair protein RecN (Recombination protein N)